MKMKAKLSILLVFVVFFSSFAQKPKFTFERKITITGQVKDSETKKGLEYVNIYIINLGDSSQTMSITDEHGFFEFSVKAGSYKLIFNLLGYESDTLKVSGFSDHNLGIIYLSPQSHQLEEVTVKAKVQDVEVDKEVVLVTKEMRSRATNTKELLEQVNGVTYNRYNNQIAVDGETNVIILVDGLQKDPAYIETLNPDRIQKIEVIRDPSGRYGLEGYAAVINIILKDNYQGFDITTMLNGTVDYKPIENAPVLPSIFNYLNFNYTRGKLNFYTTYYLYSSRFFAPSYLTRLYQTGTYMVKSPQLGLSSYKNLGFRGTLGLDYKINPLHTLSIEIKPNYHPKDQFSYNYLTKLFEDTTLTNLIFSYSENQSLNSAQNGFNSTVFYKGHFNHGIDVQSDLSFGFSNQEAKTEYLIDPVNYSFNALTTDKTQDFEYNLDLVYSYNKVGFNLGFGYKLRNMSSQKQYNFLDSQAPSEESIPYTFVDNKIRGYGYAIWKPFSKLSIKLGIGAELYTLKGSDNNNTLKKAMTIYQPFFNLTYKPFDFASIILKFRTKTHYPSASQLDPTPVPSELGIIKIGNPELNPQVTYQTSFKINVFQGVFSFEPYYKISKNYIADYIYFNPVDSLTYIQPQNIAQYEEKGLKFNFVVPFSKKLILQNSLKVYNQSIEYEGVERSLSDFSLMTNLVYYNPDLMSFGLIYMNFGTRQLTPQGYNMNGIDAVGVFLQKQFFKKSLTVTLFGILPFKGSDKWLDYKMVDYSETPFYVETKYIDLTMIKHVFAFNLQYRFSRGKTIKIKKPEEEEQEQKQQGIKLF